MDDVQRDKLMLKALTLARKGAGRVAPNPMVGSVVVKDGVVIGSGYHRRFGGLHAEPAALADCNARGHDPRGGTMFVTLEPCCHHGKTPPCTDAIITAGISHVEAACVDTFAEVSGRGIDILRSAGVTVNVGVRNAEARRLNAGFFTLQHRGRPQVILKWAQSLDAKLAFGSTVERRWITNEQSRRHVHRVRSQCGGILAGIGTVLADDPLLNVRLGRSAPQPLRVILDSHLLIPLRSQIVHTAKQYPTLICTTDAAQADLSDALCAAGCDVRFFPQHNGHVPLPAVLEELGRRGVTDLLVEGGPTIHGAFLNTGLADKLMIYSAPLIIGPDGPTIPTLPALGNLYDVTVQHFGTDTLTEAYLAALDDANGPTTT